MKISVDIYKVLQINFCNDVDLEIILWGNHNQSGGIKYSQEVIGESQPGEAYPMQEPSKFALYERKLYNQGINSSIVPVIQ